MSDGIELMRELIDLLLPIYRQSQVISDAIETRLKSLLEVNAKKSETETDKYRADRFLNKIPEPQDWGKWQNSLGISGLSTYQMVVSCIVGTQYSIATESTQNPNETSFQDHEEYILANDYAFENVRLSKAIGIFRDHIGFCILAFLETKRLPCEFVESKLRSRHAEFDRIKKGYIGFFIPLMSALVDKSWSPGRATKLLFLSKYYITLKST
jgi:hypothetical protein